MVRTIRRSYVGVFMVFATIALLCVLAGSSGAAAGDNALVSVDSSGSQVNGAGGAPSVSTDGRYAAFQSGATNLVEGDTNGFIDVFVHDRTTGATQRVNVNSSGTEANGQTYYAASMSADGRYVAFLSGATNLVSGDTNGVVDLFVRDLQAGTTQRVSVDSSGTQANESSYGTPSISADGRYVAFSSWAFNLSANDTGISDVFVRDLQAGTTREMSVGPIWPSANGSSFAPSISADGRYVAFFSGASDLVSGDTNNATDVFVRDRDTDADGVFDESGSASTRRIKVDCAYSLCGTTIGNRVTSISADGRYVAFNLPASNLVAGDTNGVNDVFVRDLQMGTTQRESVDGSGVEANGASGSPFISTDGRYVVFSSGASNLVASDTNNATDIFVRERQTVTTPPSECAAPTSTASASTSSGADYSSGTWTDEDVEVTLSAQDNEGSSSLQDLRYSATGADTMSGKTVAAADLPAKFTIDAEGTTTISYFATDKEGNHESPAKTFTVKIDKSAPTVDSVYPADTETDVDPSTYPYVIFSEPIDPDTLTPSTFTLTKQGSSTPAEATVGYETDDSGYSAAWLNLDSSLSSKTTYTATIKGGDSGVKNLSGLPLERDYSWTFTTAADTTAPDTTIDSGPSGPVRTTTASFSFSSNDGDATFECKLDSGAFESCTSPKSVPDEGLLTEGSHTFEVKATDQAGNTDPYPDSRTWTVDTTAPTTSTASPDDQSQDVAVSTNVEATFAEAMDSSTLTPSTFTLTKQDSSTLVPATVSYSSTTNKATLDPSSDLASNTTYTATMKSGDSGVKDLAGNALSANKVWTFTTAAPPAPTCTKTGTANADTISGTSGDDVICARGGNDTIKGLSGSDILRGESGNDTILGGVGNDTLDGGLGTDTASYSASLTAVNASLTTKSSTGEGSDTFSGVENLLGSSKADTLTGSTTNNKLTGGGSIDTLLGGGGNDSVIGSGGADTLKGEDGADTVNSRDGVNGNDSLDGGAGTDTKVTDATEKSIVGFP